MKVVIIMHEWLCNRLLNQFKKSGYTPPRDLPVPEYDWRNGTPEEFYNIFVKSPHPVVLRGFMKDQDLLKELSWDKVIEKYGNENVLLTKRELDGYEGKLNEVNNSKTYLHNSEKLFRKYPDIRKLFQYEKLEPYLKMKVGYEQLFIGKEGTGSPFHSAAVYNMFYQINGTKKWYFVDPYDTMLLYPVASIGRAASLVMCLWPDEYNVDAFPLFKYCPVYSTDLNPGDVLFNPPWWWHAIRNTSDTTVAVASRWHTDGIAGNNCTLYSIQLAVEICNLLLYIIRLF
jgi:hypothetical protein